MTLFPEPLFSFCWIREQTNARRFSLGECRERRSVVKAGFGSGGWKGRWSSRFWVCPACREGGSEPLFHQGCSKPLGFVRILAKLSPGQGRSDCGTAQSHSSTDGKRHCSVPGKNAFLWIFLGVSRVSGGCGEVLFSSR